MLVVDDDPDLGDVLGELLEAAGHLVRRAKDGYEGLNLFAERHPGLVLLDVEMPRLTGPEMSYRMFGNDLGQDKIPVVLLSGVTNLFSVAELVGTPYFLQKPRDFDEVLQLVGRALAERLRCEVGMGRRISEGREQRLFSDSERSRESRGCRHR